MEPNLLKRAFSLLAGRTDAAAATAEQPPEETAPPPPQLPGAAEILDAVEEPVLIVRSRRVLLANEAAREVLGSHIEGSDVRLAIRHPAVAERLTAEVPEAARIELVGLGDHERRWEMTISPLADGTRLVHLHDRSRAHAAEQMRTDFVANASHELRTPLATLLGFLETLQDEKAASDPGLRARFLSIMLEEAQRMHRLLDDLISLSRIEAERFTVPRTPVQILSLVEEVRTSCGRVMEEKKTRLSIETKTENQVVAGDRSQLLQLVQNLVINAVKYGREASEVTVRIEDHGPDFLRLSVVDQGEGIPAEHIPRLTERFYRVDAGRSRSVGGTGLGLAIVKHIVQRHRGRLDIRSVLGEGTTVTVDLPRVAPAPARP